MKYLCVVFVAVTCFVLSWCQSSPKPESALPEPAKKCLAQENVDYQYAIDFHSGKIKLEDVSAAFKCFIHCIVEDGGYMKDGQILEENIVKAAENITSVDQVRKIISNCKIVKGGNACEMSFNTYMCISSELK
ncbi:general odorant-binding protein 57c [Eupeodes corollae]|uniref:general odorant-binding protein 57c n=1 Tax=Eupeodes corollae TaxID=290404 RepID=UPI002491AD78|nr:general odorant-binding protein 57c [Eupeodes corollae]